MRHKIYGLHYYNNIITSYVSYKVKWMKNQKIFTFFIRKIPKWFFRFIMIISILLLFVSVSFFYWVHHLPSDYNGQSEEAIIVLTGAQGRLQAGADMLKDKKGKELLISGVNPQLSEAILFKQIPSLGRGQKKYVTFGREAENTIGNALEAQIWMKQHGYNSAIIVTSNWHMERALLEFNYIMPHKSFTAYPVLSYDQLNKGRFWYMNKIWLFRLWKEYGKLNMRKIQMRLS